MFPLATILLVLLLTCPSFAQGSAFKPFGGVTKMRLDNGLSIMIKEVKSSPLVSVAMFYPGGSREDPSGKHGLAHLVEHLTFLGTDKFPGSEMDKRIVLAGGKSESLTGRDFSVFTSTLPADGWKLGLEIEASRMRGCNFPEKEFEMNRALVEEEAAAVRDIPFERMRREAFAMSFSAHPYRHPVEGYVPELRLITLSDVRDFYDTWYQPNDAVLTVSGNVDAAEVIDEVYKLFHGIKKGPESWRNLPEEAPAESTRYAVLVEPTGVERLLMGVRVPSVGDEDLITLEILRRILAEGESSRLGQRLISKEGLVSSIDCRMRHARDATLMTIELTLAPGAQHPDVQEELILGLEEMFETEVANVSQWELEKAKNMIRAGMTLDNLKSQDIAVTLGGYAVMGAPEFLENYLGKLGRVTADDLSRVARAAFSPANRNVVWMASTLDPAEMERTLDNGLDVQEQEPVLKSQADKQQEEEKKDKPNRRERMSGGKRTKDRYDTDLSLRPTTYEGRLRRAGPALINAERALVLAAQRPKIDVQEVKLDNGLTLLMYRDTSLPVISAEIIFNAGPAHDPEDKSGLAYLTGRMLKEGTDTKTRLQISSAVEFVGARLGYGVDADGSRITLSCLKENFPTTFGILADISANTEFTAEKVNRVRDETLAVLAEIGNDGALSGERALRQLVYGSHPLRNPIEGSSASLKDLSQKDLVSFYNSHYTPANAILAISGDIPEPGQLVRFVNGAFPADWDGKVAPKLSGAPNRQKQQRERTIRLPEKELTHVYIGSLGAARSSDDWLAMRALAEILTGRGEEGRLARRLERDKVSFAEAEFRAEGGMFPGPAFAHVVTKPSDANEAAKSILRELSDIRKGGVDSDSLELAKAGLRADYVFGTETPAQIASRMLEAELYNGGKDPVESFFNALEKLEGGDIRKAAGEYLPSKYYSKVVAGP